MRLPDFLVIGAQKCATTDLCWQLAQHPAVCFSQPKELYFFCRDDPQVLPHPFFESPRSWEHFDWDTKKDELLAEFATAFEHATPDQRCGEGTPIYLYSQRAAQRIHESIPNCRLIVMMRNPVDRAWSAYWHHVRMRRAALPFEMHLKRERDNTMMYGCYERPLRRYYELFGRDAILPLTFEEYVADRAATLAKVQQFIGIDRRPPIAMPPKNAAAVPASHTLQLWLNALTVRGGSHFVTIHYDHPVRRRTLSEAVFSRAARLVAKLNQELRQNSAKPSLDPEVRHRLRAFYRRENSGLAALTGLNLERHWGW